MQSFVLSAGGSAALELKQNYPNKFTSINYHTPVFDTINAEQFMNKDIKPMRLAISGDPVSMFDMNATTTFHAPEFNLDLVKDSINMMTQPSLDNAVKVANSITTFDPLAGLHTINDSYSKPSTTMDFVKSAVAATATVESMGIV